MPDPRIADNRPAVLELEAGTYFFCTCGESQKQPFCDGRHKTTDFKPLKFEMAEAGRAALCQCKRSVKLPYCDGKHRDL